MSVIVRVMGSSSDSLPPPAGDDSVLRLIPANSAECWHTRLGVTEREQTDRLLRMCSVAQGGNAFIVDSGYSSSTTKGTNAAATSSLLRSAVDPSTGIIPKLIDALLRNGGSALLSICAIKNEKRPPIDLVAPFVPTADAASILSPLVAASVTSLLGFGTLLKNITSSKSFIEEEGQLSFFVLLQSGSRGVNVTTHGIFLFHEKHHTKLFALVERVTSSSRKVRSAADERRLQTRLTDFYKRHNPLEIHKVENLMKMDITEDELFEKLHKKYNLGADGEPLTTAPAAAVAESLQTVREALAHVHQSTAMKPPIVVLRIPEGMKRNEDTLHLVALLAEFNPTGGGSPSIIAAAPTPSAPTSLRGVDPMVMEKGSVAREGEKKRGASPTRSVTSPTRRVASPTQSALSPSVAVLPSPNSNSIVAPAISTDRLTELELRVEREKKDVEILESKRSRDAEARPHRPRYYYSMSQSLQDTLDHVLNEKERCLQTLVELQKDTDRMADSLRIVLERHGERRQTLRIARAKMQDAEVQLGAAKERDVQLAALMQSMESEIADLRKKLAENLRAAEGIMNDSTISGDRMSLHSVQQARIDKVDSVLAAHRKDMLAMRASASKTMEEKQRYYGAKHAELEEKVERAEVQLAASQKDHQQAKSRLTALQSESAELKQKLITVNDKLSDMQAQFLEVQSRVETTDAAALRIRTMQSEIGRLSQTNTQLSNAIEAARKRQLRAVEGAASADLLRSRLQSAVTANDEQLRVVEQKMILVELDTCRIRTATECAERWGELSREFTSSAPPSSEVIVDASNCAICSELVAHATSIEEQRIAANLQLAGQVEVLSLLESETERRTEARNAELAAAQDHIKESLQDLQEARKRHTSIVAGRHNDLKATKETFRSLYMQLCRQIAEETTSAIAKLNSAGRTGATEGNEQQQQQRKTVSETPQSRSSSRPVTPKPQPEITEDDEDAMCVAYLDWLEQQHECRNVENECGRLRQLTLTAERSLAEAADKLANDRALLSSLEGDLRQLHEKDAEVSSEIETISLQQMKQREDMEREIERTHMEGQEKLRVCIHEASSLTAATHAVKVQLEDLRREANSIVEALEVTGQPVQDLQQKVLEARKTSEVLEGRLFHARMQRAGGSRDASPAVNIHDASTLNHLHHSPFTTSSSTRSALASPSLSEVKPAPPPRNE